MSTVEGPAVAHVENGDASTLPPRFPLGCGACLCLVLSWSHRHIDDCRKSVGQFGDKFRKARESKSLSLEDVANVTKISTRMLQAIEAEHFDLLPGGVFNKGFIRAYAKHLGLDSEEAVTDYLACLRQAQIDQLWQPAHPGISPSPASAPRVVTAAKKPAVRPQAPVEVEELPNLQLPRAEHIRPRKKEFLDDRPSGVPWTLVALAAVILIAAFILWNRHSRSARTVAAKSTPSSAPVSPAPVVAGAQASPAPSHAPAPLASSRSSSGTLPPSAAASPPARPPAVIHTSAPQVATATPASDTHEKVVNPEDVTIPSDQPASIPPETAAASLALVIRATENSWISVTSDGQVVRHETLIAPANTTIHAARQIVVRVGNAAGVSFLWNSEEFPPQGAEAEVKTFVFDSEGMHPVSSAPAPNQNQ